MRKGFLFLFFKPSFSMCCMASALFSVSLVAGGQVHFTENALQYQVGFRERDHLEWLGGNGDHSRVGMSTTRSCHLLLTALRGSWQVSLACPFPPTSASSLPSRAPHPPPSLNSTILLAGAPWAAQGGFSLILRLLPGSLSQPPNSRALGS